MEEWDPGDKVEKLNPKNWVEIEICKDNEEYVYIGSLRWFDLKGEGMRVDSITLQQVLAAALEAETFLAHKEAPAVSDEVREMPRLVRRLVAAIEELKRDIPNRHLHQYESLGWPTNEFNPDTMIDPTMVDLLPPPRFWRK